MIDPEIVRSLRGRERAEYVRAVRSGRPHPLIQREPEPEPPLPCPVIVADAEEV